MSLRDQSSGNLRDQAVLAVLREDLEQLGDGVPRVRLEQAAGTRFLDRVVRRLRSEGYVIEEASSGSFKLYSEPTVSAGAPVADSGSPPPAALRGAGAPTEAAAPRLFRAAA